MVDKGNNKNSRPAKEWGAILRGKSPLFLLPSFPLVVYNQTLLRPDKRRRPKQKRFDGEANVFPYS